MSIDERVFETKEELIDFIVSNKKSILMQKKAALKYADAVSFATPLITKDGSELKAEPETAQELLKQDSIKVRVVINTTNILDSHGDVHMKGTFKQSVKQNKTFLHLQEHESKFSSIISSDAKASLKIYDWADLGYDLEGTTEALVFDSEIKADRNKFMFEQYAKGYVRNHSVGMQYINLELAINDDRYPIEKANWDKWIEEVANKKEAEKEGYFWAVTEAKIIEGSAVVRGSNYATPTISVKEFKIEPKQFTQNIDTESRMQDTFDPTELKNFIVEQIKKL